MEAPCPRPSGTILLVDEEDGVRVALRRQLTALGHTVFEASDGAEAYRSRSANVGQLKVERYWDPIRSDPRFAELVMKVGLP